MIPTAQLLHRVKEAAATQLGCAVDDIDDSVPLTEQGIDSVELMKLGEILHEQVEDLEYADLAMDSSLDAWADVVDELRGDDGV